MLRVLGFDEIGEKSLMSSLSGGLRMRVALAAAFFINPELLLLDEPTNHLDLPSVLWLENKLRGYSGSFLLVTHDRHLLENVVTSVMQLQDQKIVPFKCGFAEFEKQRALLDEKREVMVDRFLKKNLNVDSFSPEYRLKRDYQDWIQKRQKRKVQMQGKFTFPAPAVLPAAAGVDQKSISLIKLEKVRFCYNVEKELPFIFDTPVDFEVTQKTRMGIMGPNGAGKSTLLKLITGKLTPTEGKMTTNPDFTLAYFGQHSTKELSMEDTPLEFMTNSFPKSLRGDLTSHLAKTSVDSDVANTRMRNLSYSQRSCVIFAKLTLVPPHLLIMDEPTNFLDLDSVDSLIGAARKFSGGLIVVTHNRDFLKRCSQTFLSIVPGAFLEFDSMRDAERATYSFIDALEKGEQIDHKAAIQENRGGGAVHTEEYLAETELRRKKLAAQNAKKDAAAAAEVAAAAAIVQARLDKIAAKKAVEKTDWAKDDECWAPVSGPKGTVWTKVIVVRNVPAMGVTVALPGGGNKLFDLKKLKMANPEAGGARPQSAPVAAGGKGQQQGRGGGKGNAGGKGKGSAGGKGKGAGRGGGKGAR